MFARPQFDWLTNFVKWFAIRFSYLLFRCGMTANLLDVLAMMFVCGGFILMTRAVHGERALPLVGIGLLCFHVFVDFADGAIAKARGETSRLGHYLDEIGCDIDRIALFILLGIYAGHPVFVLANAFAIGTLIQLAPLTKKELPTTGWIGRICRIYCHKFSFLSVRATLMVYPLALALIILNRWDLQGIAIIMSYLYEVLAAVWLLLCIPNYAGHVRVARHVRKAEEQS